MNTRRAFLAAGLAAAALPARASTRPIVVMTAYYG